MKSLNQAFNNGAAADIEIDSNVEESNLQNCSQPPQAEVSAAQIPNFSYICQQNYSNIPVQFINPQPIYYTSNYAANVSYIPDMNPVYCDNPSNMHTHFINDHVDPAYMPPMNFRYSNFSNKGTHDNHYHHKENRDGTFHSGKSQWSGDTNHTYKSKHNSANNYKRDKTSNHFNSKVFSAENTDQINNNRDEPVELLITNLDYNIPPKEWKKIISTQLQNALNINQPVFIQTRLDGSLCATVKINCLSEARLAISHFHRKKIGYKRIHVNIINPQNNSQPFQGLKQEVVALLQSVYNNSLSVSKFIELFARRFHRTITISDLYKLRDIVEIKDDSNSSHNGGGRVIQLLNTNNDSHISKESVTKVNTIEPSVCRLHCNENLAEHMQSADSCILPSVVISLNTLKQQVHQMLMTHDGSIPLLSFVKCYEAEFGELAVVKSSKTDSLESCSCSDISLEHSCLASQCSTCSSGSTSGVDSAEILDNGSKQTETCGNGVPLEHLLSCVPGVQIISTLCGSKKLVWEVNVDKNGACCGDNSQWSTNLPHSGTKMSNDILSDRLHQFSREVVELLKHQHNCRLLLSKFIPTYHHYFGKQCRVADYGYAKLNELMDSIKHVVHVMGSGTVRHLTLSHKVQVRRFTNELVKVLKSQTTKSCKLTEFPAVFEKILKREFRIVEYGVCFIEDMLKEIPENTVELVTALVPNSYHSDDNLDEASMCSNETFLCIPKRIQTAEEKERTMYFAQEVFQLLKQSPRVRLPFNKFIPSYHHHFSKQCKVSDYGFSKLFELLEAISHITKIFEENEEKYVTLTRRECLRVFADQILTLLETSPKKCMTLQELSDLFLIQHGYAICPEDYGAKNLQQLIGKIPRIVCLQVPKLRNNPDGSGTPSSEEATNLNPESLNDYSENDINVCLNDRSDIKNLAHKLLLLLLEIPEGILPGVQFIDKYRAMFREDPDVSLIESQLFEIIYIIRDSMDYNNFWIRLKPLVMLSRDIRDVLRIYQGKILLSHLESAYIWLFGVELRPQIYGFGSMSSMIQAVPFVATLIGRGLRTTVCLSNDFIGKLSHRAAYSFEPIMDADDMEAESKEQESSGNVAYCFPGPNQPQMYTIVNCINQNGVPQCHLPMAPIINADLGQESVNPAFINHNPPPMTYSMTYACNRNLPHYTNQNHPEQKHLDQLVEQLAFDRTSPSSIHFQNGSVSNSSICTMPSPTTSFSTAHYSNAQAPQILSSNSNPITISNTCCFPPDAVPPGPTLWQPNFAPYCTPPQAHQQFFTFDPQYNSVMPSLPSNPFGQESNGQSCGYKALNETESNYQLCKQNDFYNNDISEGDCKNLNESSNSLQSAEPVKLNGELDAAYNDKNLSDSCTNQQSIDDFVNKQECQQSNAEGNNTS